MPKITYHQGQNLCSETGCNEQATHTCDYQNCGRLLCGRHLRDLDKPIRQDYATAKRAGIVYLGGIYCQEHANEIAKQAIWSLRLNTIFGYIGAFIKGIIQMFWEILKIAFRDAFR